MNGASTQRVCVSDCSRAGDSRAFGAAAGGRRELFRIARDSQRVEFPDRVAFEAVVAVLSWLAYMSILRGARARALR